MQEKSLIDADLLTIPLSEIVEYKILETTDACTIVEITTTSGMTIYNVIAAIATVFLPETAYGLCMLTVGNKDICSAVYDVTDAVVSLRGAKIYRGVTKGITWIAKKGRYSSSATIQSSVYEIVDGAKKVFQLYRENKCVKWQSINEYEPCDCYGSVTFFTFCSHLDISVYIEDYFIGVISKRWINNYPNCRESGTAHINLPPGKYRYQAISNCNHKIIWKGYIDITSNNCQIIPLLCNH